jgi:hypothetical protein
METDELVDQFVAITGATNREKVLDFLLRFNNNLEASIESFFEVFALVACIFFFFFLFFVPFFVFFFLPFS